VRLVHPLSALEHLNKKKFVQCRRTVFVLPKATNHVSLCVNGCGK
jgi:hypothetical protein